MSGSQVRDSDPVELPITVYLRDLAPNLRTYKWRKFFRLGHQKIGRILFFFGNSLSYIEINVNFEAKSWHEHITNV